METSKFYLNKLPKELQDRILELIEETVNNTTIPTTKEQYLAFLQKKKSNNFEEFLIGAFNWSKTTEGRSYWEEIVKKYN